MPKISSLIPNAKSHTKVDFNGFTFKNSQIEIPYIVKIGTYPRYSLPILR